MCGSNLLSQNDFNIIGDLMVIINFTVDFAKKKILDGTKTRTMRPVRNNPNSVWNRLYEQWQSIQQNGYCAGKIPQLQLWWQQRSRYYLCGCGRTKVTQKDLGKCCEYCMELAVHKQAQKLADAVLVNITKRTLGSLTEAEWRADGFEPLEHTIEDEHGNLDVVMLPARDRGLTWFANMYGNVQGYEFCRLNSIAQQEILNFEVYIIEWKVV
jgi:hypothetical protein